jgi:lysophospholipase L1-like esterase
MIKFLQNFSLTVLSVLVGASLCEVVLRKAWPQVRFLRGSLAAFHEELGYTLVPGARGSVTFFEFGSYRFEINDHGFRDDRLREDAFKILALGDSFTFGDGVEQRYAYPHQLESILASQTNLAPVDVINAGIPSYDTRSELKYFEILSKSIRPGIVLVNILANDILSNLQRVDSEHYKSLSENKAPIVVERHGDSGVVPLPGALKKFLQNESHLYILTARGFHSVLLGLRLRNPVCYGLEVLPETDDVKSAWAQTKQLLAEFQSLAGSIGAELVLVHIPQNTEFLTNDTSEERKCDWQAASRHLDAIARSLSLPMVSTFDALRRQGGEDLYYPVDGHLTSRGYRVVADVVASYLTKNNLIPLAHR